MKISHIIFITIILIEISCVCLLVTGTFDRLYCESTIDEDNYIISLMDKYDKLNKVKADENSVTLMPEKYYNIYIYPNRGVWKGIHIPGNNDTKYETYNKEVYNKFKSLINKYYVPKPKKLNVFELEK